MEKITRVVLTIISLAGLAAFLGCSDSGNGTPAPVTKLDDGDPGNYAVCGYTKEELYPYTIVGGVYIEYFYKLGGQWIELGEEESWANGYFSLVMRFPGSGAQLTPGTEILAITYKEGYAESWQEFEYWPLPNGTMYRDLYVQQHVED